ncbi:hypothetical protein EX30DRAFT_44633 [Ascodesmis nigricans]|uniref:C3H1-type domain-containing protein n=1 Tax=Ascodesmis nigricans TaxID=341454 RepID=A0A4S2MWK8_9PEZI|nr:hypothetical protein EX30DRAFT_44633 [Ascodesmis nigricans]
MSNGYIYNPPPPPPPRATASSGSQDLYPSQRGGRGRGGRGNRGDNNSRGGGHGYRGGGGGKNWQNNSSTGPVQQWSQSSTPASASNVHLNPAFFPGLQAPQAPPVAPQAPSQTIQPSPTNLFYSAPLPSPIFYGDLNNTPAASTLKTPPQSSYGQYAYPLDTCTGDTQPPNKKQRLGRSSRPDMSEADWLALNGGKLIGTNILPPQTDEEIAGWIAERKKRFPSKATQVEREKEKAEREQKRREQNEEHWKKKRELHQAEEEDRKKKEQAIEERKARLRAVKDAEKAKRGVDGDGEDDDDGPPEEISGKTRTVMRDDRKKSRGKSQKLCREFQQKGHCSRGAQCWYAHKTKEKSGANSGKGGRTSLYQRFVENDRGHDNELLVKVIKHLAEQGLLDDPPSFQHSGTDTNSAEREEP